MVPPTLNRTRARFLATPSISALILGLTLTGGIVPTAQAADGTLSGTVTEAGSRARLGGVSVQAFCWQVVGSDPGQLCGQTQTATDGSLFTAAGAGNLQGLLRPLAGPSRSVLRRWYQRVGRELVAGRRARRRIHHRDQRGTAALEADHRHRHGERSARGRHQRDRPSVLKRYLHLGAGAGRRNRARRHLCVAPGGRHLSSRVHRARTGPYRGAFSMARATSIRPTTLSWPAVVWPTSTPTWPSAIRSRGTVSVDGVDMGGVAVTAFRQVPDGPGSTALGCRERLASTGPDGTYALYLPDGTYRVGFQFVAGSVRPSATTTAPSASVRPRMSSVAGADVWNIDAVYGW